MFKGDKFDAVFITPNSNMAYLTITYENREKKWKHIFLWALDKELQDFCSTEPASSLISLSFISLPECH